MRQHFNEQFPQQAKKAKSTKQINEGESIKLAITRRRFLDGVLHRRAVAAEVAASDTAKEDALILALMQDDANALSRHLRTFIKKSI